MCYNYSRPPVDRLPLLLLWFEVIKTSHRQEVLPIILHPATQGLLTKSDTMFQIKEPTLQKLLGWIIFVTLILVMVYQGIFQIWTTSP
jgi:hypothetical protein